MSETVIVAIITACSAIIPTIITVILNNWYNLKLKKYEANILQKQQVATEFVETVGKIISYNGGLSIKDLSDFYSSCNKLMLHFPNVDLKLINEIRESLYQSEPETKIKLINELSTQLSKSIFEK